MSAVAPLVTRWPVHSDEEIAAVADVLRSGRVNYWTGREGEAFETEWARSLALPHALTVSNGTTALECALRGVGLQETAAAWMHDGLVVPEVIVPARTFIATASAVVQCLGRPVLADISAESLCVTAETLEAARTSATVGVVVVHYGGLPCPDMDNIVRWAMRHGLWIVEDCAHAHGAPGVGMRSHAAAWSFCVGKIMSTGGEGGMVACLDDGVAARMRAYRDHGRYQVAGRTARDMSGAGAVGHTEFVYSVEEFGTNIRATEMQSVLGRIQLRGLAAQIARRRYIAASYAEALASVGVAPMFTDDQRNLAHVYYLYHVNTPGRKAENMLALIEQGVPARFGGCDNIGREPAFTKRGWNYECPQAEAVGAATFSLPLYPSMTDSEVERVCDAVRGVVRGK